MARIFISYKRIDKKQVFKIKEIIEKKTGEKCWIDLDGIESDAQFKNVIINAINQCDIVLFMYSKAHSYIRDFEKDWTVRELSFAAQKNKRIVFVNLDGSPLTDIFAFDYGNKQQVDGRNRDLIERLIVDIKTWLNTTIVNQTFNNKVEEKDEEKVNVHNEFFKDEKSIHPLYRNKAWFIIAFISIIIISAIVSYLKNNENRQFYVNSISKQETAVKTQIKDTEPQVIATTKEALSESDITRNDVSTSTKDNTTSNANSDTPTSSKNEVMKSDDDIFRIAKANNDYKTIEILASRRYKPAYIYLAKYYIKNSTTHNLAYKYAKLAEEAGYQESEEILKTLELYDF